MKLTPRQAEAIDEAISFYVDHNADGRFDVVLVRFQRDSVFQALVKQAPGPSRALDYE